MVCKVFLSNTTRLCSYGRPTQLSPSKAEVDTRVAHAVKRAEKAAVEIDNGGVHLRKPFDDLGDRRPLRDSKLTRYNISRGFKRETNRKSNLETEVLNWTLTARGRRFDLCGIACCFEEILKRTLQ